MSAIRALSVGLTLFTNVVFAAEAGQFNEVDQQFFQRLKQHQSEYVSGKASSGTGPETKEPALSDAEKSELKQLFVDGRQDKKWSPADQAIFDMFKQKSAEPGSTVMNEAIVALDPKSKAKWEDAPHAGNTDQSLPTGDMKDIKTIVFVSLGIPEKVLKQLYKQADGRQDVVMVFRGWKTPHMSKLVNKIVEMTDGGTVNTMIDPRFFRTYHVDSVPVVLHKTKKYGWRRAIGEFSLVGAEEAVEAGRVRPVLGNVYDVTEPDLLDELEKNLAAVDWAKEQKKLTDQINNYNPHYDLPTTDKSTSYWVDLTMTFNESIPGEDGEILIEAGTKINPFEYVTFPSRFIVFNPDDERQIALAKDWATRYPDNVVLVTHFPDRKPGDLSLAEKIGQPIFPLQPYLVERFGFKKVPALAYQDGVNLRVDLVKP